MVEWHSLAYVSSVSLLSKCSESIKKKKEKKRELDDRVELEENGNRWIVK